MGKLYCLATILLTERHFKGQFIICNLCCSVTTLVKLAFLSVNSISHVSCAFSQILLLGELPCFVKLFSVKQCNMHSENIFI